jgi:hypothetical protein
MIKAGIKNVYLLENSENIFNPEINLEMKDWGKTKGIRKIVYYKTLQS